MKNIIVYDDGVNRFSAFTYEKIFEQFKQIDAYMCLLDGISDEIYSDCVDTTEPLINEIFREIYDLLVIYHDYQNENNDDKMEKFSNYINTIIEKIVPKSSNTISYFKKYWEKELTKIPFYN